VATDGSLRHVETGHMTITFRATELDSATDYDESLLAPPSAQPIGGDITVRAFVPFTSDDGRILSGSWESEPGQARWEFTDRGEFIQVISGRMTVEQDGEPPVELTAGSSAVFPIGWKGTWTVHETLRKVFVVYNA
jgi:uncharacterized cupin superfamily protein